MKIRVRVIPGAKKKSISVQKDLLTEEFIYVVKVTAKPVDGEANKALIDYLAEHFGCSKRKVTLLKGKTSRLKVLEIEDI